MGRKAKEIMMTLRNRSESGGATLRRFMSPSDLEGFSVAPTKVFFTSFKNLMKQTYKALF
jgi:hypothetical protein